MTTLLCFTTICITAAGLQGQCLTTAVLRDENRYISETSSQDVNTVLKGERACSCVVRRELELLQNLTQISLVTGLQTTEPASVHAASWTLIQKHQVWLPLWHGLSLIQFSSVQQLAGTLSNKMKEARHSGEKERGSIDERNNANLPCNPG